MKYFLYVLLIFIIAFNHNNSIAEDIYIDDIAVAEQEAEKTDKKLLLIFGADWCKYCVVLKNDLEKQLDIVTESYVVCHIDYDTNKDLVRKYRINGGIPHSVIVNQNGSIKTKLGYSGFSGYKAWLGL